MRQIKLGVKIKEFRTARQWTQKDLAEKLGLAKSTVSLYETNRREPETEILVKMANLFQVSVDELLGNDPPGKEPKVVLYGSDGKLVDISELSQEDQTYILNLAEKFKRMNGR